MGQRSGWRISAATALLAGCTSSNQLSSPSDASAALTSGSSAIDGAMGQCRWPSDLYDGGPGACRVARAYVQCVYPSGVECEGGVGASSPSGSLTMGCLSDVATSCSGCTSTSGAASCTSLCAATEYAISCGGPPRPLPDGGFGVDYQEPPDACTGAGGTPAGNAYFCCPCE